MPKPTLDQIKAGEYAFIVGKAMMDNPHDLGTTAWGRWHFGWLKAQKDAAA